MTKREKQLLDLIKQNPLISQKELAEELNITRSSVAVHITNLLKKGYIVGKGYILREQGYVCVIGGSNIDIQGFPNFVLKEHDSNPGRVKISLGGVGRNIAENISKLQIPVKLISALGNDVYGNKILEEARISGINMEDSLIFQDESTSTYLSILDEQGDMKVAIAHMDVIDKMTIEFIRDKSHVIKNSKVCVLDTNLPEHILDYIVNNYSETKFFLDTVSSKKAEKVKRLIGKFHTIKPNKIEAEILSGMKINTKEDVKKAGKYFLAQGVKRVFISLSGDGLYYLDENNEGFMENKDVEVVNATGAGDAFSAGLVYTFLQNYNIEESAKFCMGAAIMAISHEDTINPNLSYENILKIMKELKI
ncbi:PfkB family carbohydrate kinase [Peptostreptococcaceae bacterium AGR-M142]